ncbi:MAG: radical SAM protein [bacterium]|nr:radical SAM protein [bacterium]
MKILLILPPSLDSAYEESDMYETMMEEAGSYPPLGLLYVATYAKVVHNFQVKVIDSITEKLDYSNISEIITKYDPDILGISMTTDFQLSGFKCAALAKSLKKEILVVAGGPHVQIYPKETISKENIDFIIFGEGEIAFSELILTLSGKRNKSPEEIMGVFSKKNISKTMTRVKIDDLNSLPFPDRRFLKLDHYKNFLSFSNPITTMMTSRGCAFNCNYCNSIERAQKVRLRSPENIINEFKEIKKIGINDVIIFDENFMYDIERVFEICNGLKKEKLQMRWHCRSRIDMKITQDLLYLMKESGCYMIQFGIEAGTPRIQKLINKNLDLEKVRKVVNMVKNAGIYTFGNFMIGLPTESEDEMMASIKFAESLNLDYVPFYIFSPIPDSNFYLNALKEGTIEKDYWREYSEDPYNKKLPNYYWPKHDPDQLRKIYKKAFRKFYLNPKYLLRALIRKQSYKQKIWQIKSGIKLLFG